MISRKKVNGERMHVMQRCDMKIIKTEILNLVGFMLITTTLIAMKHTYLHYNGKIMMSIKG